MAALQVRLLGRFTVHRGTLEVAPAEFGGRMARTLLRILVTRRGAFVSKDELTEALWPKRPPSDPSGNLEVLVSRARRALGDASLIVTGTGGYSFARDERCEVDIESFLARVGRGRAALQGSRMLTALAEFEAAIELWRGEPLAEDAYAEWAQEPRRELARAYLEALEGAASAALAAGESSRAAAMAERAAAREPLREASQLLLVRALAASGDQAAALASYEAFRERLREELGLDPSREAAELHAGILRGEPVGKLLVAPEAGAASQPLPAELRFVGREGEVVAILDAVTADAPAVVLIPAPSGAGKSRLLTETAARSAVPVAAARAFLAERDEAWSLGRSLLRAVLAIDVSAAGGVPERCVQALVEVVPELGEVRAVPRDPLDPESRRALAVEGALRLMEATAWKGCGLAVDDAQWADETSLSVLRRAVRRVPRLGIVVAYRPEEVVPGGPLASFLGDLAVLGRSVATLALPPLPQEGIADLFVGEELTRAVMEHSDRTPLAVVEVVRTLAERGVVERDRHGRWRARVEGAGEQAREAARLGKVRAIDARVAREPPDRRELLALLALLGWEAPARILAAALAVEQGRVLDDLDALAGAELVRLGNEGWAVAHDLVGETVVGSLPRATRGRLHAKLAQALLAEGKDASEVARHLTGAGDTGAAAEAFSRAARQALDRHANGEALRLAEAGLALRPAAAVRSTLFELRGEARARGDDLVGARADLRAALRGRAGRPERSRILARLAMLTFGAEDLPLAAEIAELALAEAGQDQEARAGALFVGGVIDMNAGRPDRARHRFDEALVLFERTGNARGVADILDGRATATLLEGDLTGSVTLLERVARLFLELGELVRVGGPRNARGWALVYMGRPSEGLSQIEEALDLERTLGHAEGESWCLTNRAEALAALGRVPEAIHAAEEALAIAERLGHREWTANALRALGLARRAGGDLAGAADAFRRSLAAAEPLPVFACMAAAGLASVLIAQDRLAEAEPFVARALAAPSPVGLYEARLAHAELAAARGDPDAAAIAAEARSIALAGGHLVSAARLELLADGAAGRTASRSP